MCQTSPDLGNAPIATSPFTSVQGAADAAQTAQEGARLLVVFWIEQGVPFTSGHVVNALREARGRSLMVNQRPTGHALQDFFTSGDMPSYDDELGGGTRPMRKLRYTERTDTRTPVGCAVYVYGPSEEEIDAFEFELCIAEAPMVDDGQGGQTSAATALLNATPTVAPGTPGASPIPPVTPSGTVAVANGKMVPGNTLAVVHQSGNANSARLCVPRLAFEALAFETGFPVVGGQPLYLCVFGDKVTISQNAKHPEKVKVTPTTDRLRLHLKLDRPFPVGTQFEVVVADDVLTIDLSKPLP